MKGSPYPWCRVLASCSDDVLAAAFADVMKRFAPTGVVELLHRRVWDNYGADDKDRWFLFVVVVFASLDDARDPRFVEATHASLCRAIQTAADAYTHCCATIERAAEGDPCLNDYHRAKRGFALPPPPPRRESLTVGGKVSEPAEKTAPTPAPKPPPPSTQKSLF